VRVCVCVCACVCVCVCVCVRASMRKYASAHFIVVNLQKRDSEQEHAQGTIFDIPASKLSVSYILPGLRDAVG
jgi:hypothetical protein